MADNVITLKQQEYILTICTVADRGDEPAYELICSSEEEGLTLMERIVAQGVDDSVLLISIKSAKKTSLILFKQTCKVSGLYLAKVEE